MNERSFETLFFYLLGVLGGVALCFFFPPNRTFKSNTKIEPKLEIHCDGVKCDTTFIYKISKK